MYEGSSPSKQFGVRDVISKLWNVVVCLQGSKVSHVSRSFLRSFGGSFLDKCVVIESNGASGGLITCWSSRIFTCQEVIVRSYSITNLISFVKNGTSFNVTNVYGSATWDGKEECFSELTQLKESCMGKWIVCGDF